jgi:hypothetical protein
MLTDLTGMSWTNLVDLLLSDAAMVISLIHELNHLSLITNSMISGSMDQQYVRD